MPCQRSNCKSHMHAGSVSSSECLPSQQKPVMRTLVPLTYLLAQLLDRKVSIYNSRPSAPILNHQHNVPKGNYRQLLQSQVMSHLLCSCQTVSHVPPVDHLPGGFQIRGSQNVVVVVACSHTSLPSTVSAPAPQARLVRAAALALPSVI